MFIQFFKIISMSVLLALGVSWTTSLFDIIRKGSWKKRKKYKELNDINEKTAKFFVIITGILTELLGLVILGYFFAKVMMI